MEQAHKQRLVGGIVLFALGLIFIPMVLDFSREDRTQIENAEIPPSPDAMKMEVLPLDVWSQKIDPEINRDTRIVETPRKEEPKPEEKAPVEKGSSDKSKADTAEKPKTEAVAQKPKSEPKPEIKKSVPSGASAWVVQVASLTIEKKAFELRDTLRKAGHPAFVERVNSAKGLIFRVKAGPVLEHAKAESMKKAINKATKLDGLVMRHR